MKKWFVFKKRGANGNAGSHFFWLSCGIISVALFLNGCETFDSGSFSKAISKFRGGAGGALSTQQIIAGLKEALRVGTENAVKQTSREGGYSGNPAIRIPLPEKLKPMVNGLRKIGLGGQVDVVEGKMNRAAELAAAKAAPVFTDAVRKMSFTDAKRILEGDNTAATDYFRSETYDELERRFSPIIKKQMNQLGVVRLFEELQNRYNQLPLVTDSNYQIEDYVVSETLDGLFTVLGNEERQIRQNPKARTTELLRSVFGNAGR